MSAGDRLRQRALALVQTRTTAALRRLGIALALPWAVCLMGATPWTPASPGAPALGLWFDAADSATLTPNPSNPAQVVGWHDKSGNGRDATADAASAPSLTTLNGKTALDFGPFLFGSTNPHMAFPVVQAQTVFKVWGSAQGGSFFMTNTTNYTWHRANRLNDETNPANAIFEVDHTYAEPAVLDGDAITRLNGTVVDPSTAGLSGDWDIVDNRPATGNSFPTDTLALDRSFRTGGQGIAEVIVMTGRATESDVQRIEGYLAWKWGLQGKLPPNHPYKNAAPTVVGLLNGSFEAGSLAANSFTYNPTDQAPWVFNGSGDMTLESPISNQTPATPDGRIAGFVQTRSAIEQGFTVDAGSAGAYAVTFLIAQRQYLYPQTLSVQIDGVEVMSIPGPSDANWHTVTTPAFNLATGSHTLRFQGMSSNDATAFVDAVALVGAVAPAPPVLIAELRFEESAWTGNAGEAVDSSGSGHPGTATGSPPPAPRSNAGARPGDPGTCSYAAMAGAAFDVPNLPVSTVAGDTTTVMFWMHWDGSNSVMPMGWTNQALWLTSGKFGFNTAASDVYGISSAGLANGWHHVAAVFVNGNVGANRLYIDGVAQALSQQQNSPDDNASYVGSTLRIGGWTRDGDFRFTGFLDEFRIYTGTAAASDIAAAVTAGHACAANYPPAGFNAYESATAAGATTGMLHTKVAGAPFSVDVVALDASPAAIRTGFTGSVKVEVLDASDNSGALDANACRASWTPVPSGASTSVAFVSGDAGRKTVTLTEPEAWRDLRLRITTPATGAAATIACSTDDFAMRPASFASLTVGDNDSSTAGSARILSNSGASGGVVHRAGRPFSVTTVAVNANGNTTVNYAGTPSPMLSVCGGAACVAAGSGWTFVANENGSFSFSGTRLVRYGVDTRWVTQVLTGGGTCGNGVFGDPAYGTVKHCEVASLGALSLVPSAVAGVIARTGSYDDAGAFALQLVDDSFAAVDAGDGTTAAERTIASASVTVGRFVPDHFDLVPLASPVLRTFDTAGCSARSFTYIGQPFGYAAVAQARVIARNAAGATTGSYSGALWKLGPSGVSQSHVPTPGTPALDASAATAPNLTSNGDGSGLIVGAAAGKLRFVRSGSAPIARFNASIALTWSAQDTSEAGVAGNGSIATATPLVFPSIAFDAGNEFRFGMLRLLPAYGSELIDLPVLIEAQYWDGQRMATNAADQCTALPAAAVAMGNYQRSLAACKTALGAGSATLTSGRGYLRLARPGNGNAGSVDLTVQLGSSATGQVCSAVNGATAATAAAGLGWLQGRWGNAPAFDQNPSTRASFGQYRSPLIYQREMF